MPIYESKGFGNDFIYSIKKEPLTISQNLDLEQSPKVQI